MAYKAPPSFGSIRHRYRIHKLDQHMWALCLPNPNSFHTVVAMYPTWEQCVVHLYRGAP